jgi:ketosteroid isomerase-like protein
MNPEEHEVLKMERAALNRWGNGDPSGFLEISAPDIVYFDPMQKRRLDGIAELTRMYEGIRGQVHVDRYEMFSPLVQECGDVAVLTFAYAGYVGGQEYRWFCTEVYRRDAQGWRIIQTHWSRPVS